MSFGQYLRHLRNSKKLTLNQLAELSGISNAQISRLEVGKRASPKPETIKKLAPFLGVKYEEMMMAAGYYETEDITDDWIKEIVTAPKSHKEAMRTIWEVLKKL